MSYTGNFSGSCKTRGVLFAVFCLSLNGRERERDGERERETNRSGWSHVAGSRNAYSYWIRGINKRACLYSRYFFCFEYDSKRERRIDRWSQSLVRATPATAGYVANISERAFTQGTFFVASIGQ
jgi:hypothetical protein